MRLTFKKHPKPTGRSSIGHPYPETDIKIDGNIIGSIHPPYWNSNNWKVSFSVIKPEPDDNPNSDWKWIRLRKQFSTEPEAREFIKKNIEAIQSKYSFKVLA